MNEEPSNQNPIAEKLLAEVRRSQEWAEARDAERQREVEQFRKDEQERLRDQIALSALNGMLAWSDVMCDPQYAALQAYRYADAMLAERDRIKHTS